MQAQTSKVEEYECMSEEFIQIAKGQKFYICDMQAYDNEKNLLNVDIEYIRKHPDEFRPVTKNPEVDPEISGSATVKKKDIGMCPPMELYYVISTGIVRFAGTKDGCMGYINTANPGLYVVAQKYTQYNVRHEIKVTEGEV